MIVPAPPLMEIFYQHRNHFKKVVAFDNSIDKLMLLDFTAANKNLDSETVNNTEAFCQYINGKLLQAGALYGIGGYDEHRTVYSRSRVFDDGEEPRRLHLGTDIWGVAGTPVFAPLDGFVHSVAFNNRFGDYGGTIILQHQLCGLCFHTLYGHLSLASVNGLVPNQLINAGRQIGEFGLPDENGQWPPHLHFQIITDMQGMVGDYPGVCKFSEREKYLANCPNPDLILNMYPKP